jgi:hypothetical protein
MSEPDDLALVLLGLAQMAGVPVYFVLQPLLLLRVRDGWRRAVLAPLLPMGAVLAWTCYAFLKGSNLFPLVLIFTAPLADVYLLVIVLLRGVRQLPKSPPPS